MPDEMDGLKDVLKELDKAGADIVAGAAKGMTLATLATERHIKKEYSRPRTGKGFTDRTARLRASIGQAVQVTKNAIIGVVYAGTHYAVYVEFRWSGKYAYLWPGVKDMKKQIWDLLYEGAKRGLRK